MSGTYITPIQQTVLAACPGADLPMVQTHLRFVLNEFLRRTLAWRDRFELTLESGVAFYTIPLPQPYVVAGQLLAAFYGAQQIMTGSTTGVAPTSPGTGAMSPRLVELRSPTQIQVYPAPVSAGEPLKLLTLDVAWTYAPTVTTGLSDLSLPTQLIHFQDTLTAGVLARMHAMMERPWSSKSLAGLHMARYRAGMQEARAASDTANARDGAFMARPWRFRRFA